MVLILNSYQTLGISGFFFLLSLITYYYHYSVLAPIFLILSFLFLLKVVLYYKTISERKQKKARALNIIHDLSTQEPLKAVPLED